MVSNAYLAAEHLYVTLERFLKSRRTYILVFPQISFMHVRSSAPDVCGTIFENSLLHLKARYIGLHPRLESELLRHAFLYI